MKKSLCISQTVNLQLRYFTDGQIE